MIAYLRERGGLCHGVDELMTRAACDRPSVAAKAGSEVGINQSIARAYMPGKQRRSEIII